MTLRLVRPGPAGASADPREAERLAWDAVHAWETYVAALEAEIDRVRAEIRAEHVGEVASSYALDRLDHLAGELRDARICALGAELRASDIARSNAREAGPVRIARVLRRGKRR